MTRQMAMVGFLQAQNCRDILLHRICLLVAPSDRLPRVTNSVAIVGTADMPITCRARRSDAFEPKRTYRKCRAARNGTFS
jgi:hypothetical protein